MLLFRKLPFLLSARILLKICVNLQAILSRDFNHEVCAFRGSANPQNRIAFLQ